MGVLPFPFSIYSKKLNMKFNLYDILVENQLLQESTVQDVYKKHKDIPMDIFLELCKADPKYNKNNYGEFAGKYTHWICQQYENGNITKNDIPNLKVLLKKFADNKNKLGDVNLKDMTYEDLEELIDELDSENKTLDLVLQKVNNKHVRNTSEVWYHANGWLVIIPHSWEADVYWGSRTHWCTATNSSRYHYDKYLDEYGGKYYINIDENRNRKYQFHFESDQFKDEEDAQICKFEDIDLPDDLREKYEEVYGDLSKYEMFSAEELIDQCYEDSVILVRNDNMTLSLMLDWEELDRKKGVEDGTSKYYIYDDYEGVVVDGGGLSKDDILYSSSDTFSILKDGESSYYVVYLTREDDGVLNVDDYFLNKNDNSIFCIDKNIFYYIRDLGDSDGFSINFKNELFNDCDLKDCYVFYSNNHLMVQVKDNNLGYNLFCDTNTEHPIIEQEYPVGGEHFNIENGIIKCTDEEGKALREYDLNGNLVNGEQDSWKIANVIDDTHTIKQDRSSGKYAIFVNGEQFCSKLYDKIESRMFYGISLISLINDGKVVDVMNLKTNAFLLNEESICVLSSIGHAGDKLYALVKDSNGLTNVFLEGCKKVFKKWFETYKYICEGYILIEDNGNFSIGDCLNGNIFDIKGKDSIIKEYGNGCFYTIGELNDGKIFGVSEKNGFKILPYKSFKRYKINYEWYPSGTNDNIHWYLLNTTALEPFVEFESYKKGTDANICLKQNGKWNIFDIDGNKATEIYHVDADDIYVDNYRTFIIKNGKKYKMVITDYNNSNFELQLQENGKKINKNVITESYKDELLSKFKHLI